MAFQSIAQPSKAMKVIFTGLLVIGLHLTCFHAEAGVIAVKNSDARWSTDKICIPQVWIPDPSWDDLLDGDWKCLQSATRDTNNTQPIANQAAFEATAYQSASTVLIGRMYLESRYEHDFQLALDGPAGESSNVWMYYSLDGSLGVIGAGIGAGYVEAMAGISVWQGSFDGWGWGPSTPDANTFDDRYGPLLDGLVPEPDVSYFWREELLAGVLWWNSDDFTKSIHELLDLNLIAGDPNSELWVSTFLHLEADSLAITGGGQGETDFLLKGHGLRYGFSVDSAPPIDDWPTINNNVPEPSTLLLFGTAFAFLGFLSQDRKLRKI